MRYPGASWQPIGVNIDRGGNTPRYLIEHIMQGTLAGTNSWFRNPAAQVSAHFGIGKDGTVIQWVDTADVAWHAMAANHMSIGVEHEGDTGELLTVAQLEADAKLLAWATQHHPIRLKLAREPVGDSGLAYHALGAASWGGHLQCPGEPIISQLPHILATAKDIREGHVSAKVTKHVTLGHQSLADLAAGHDPKANPAQVLRLTAEHSPGAKFEGNVAAYLNDVFEGRLDAQADIPVGLTLYLPAKST